ASDLGLPFVAVGLLYRHGYFRQRLNRDGWQEAIFSNWNFHELPLSLVRDANGNASTISVDIPDHPVYARIWEAKVGRIRLFLLDTDIDQNSNEDRRITYQLYGGDLQMRLRQEMLLGIGGCRALAKLGIRPTVYHMNEGHSAFLAIERIRRLVQEEGLPYYTALQVVAAGSIFTTHTPVPAGNDVFSPDLMRQYFGKMIDELKVPWDDFMKLGRPWNGTLNDLFSMTILALRTSRSANGVSRLHGEVSQAMWQNVWPNVPQHEVPITSITNGVHTATWLASDLADLYSKYLGDDWKDRNSDQAFWDQIAGIPDDALWLVHAKLKGRLIQFVRNRLREQRLRVGETPDCLRAASRVLDPSVLTIGFARRFAPYKRATLLFRDLERLKKIVHHPERPVQFIFAGKSHPRDEEGKKILQTVYQISMNPEFSERIVFVEDYDANVARHLVQGVDVWLNTPTRPLEASGTSGEKAAANGVLNLSVLDGWWCEGYNGRNGWAVGEEFLFHDLKLQDEVDANSLYTLLEQEVVPLYYERREDSKLPAEWLARMRESIRTILPVFNTYRMVQDYANRLYMPAASKARRLRENNFAAAKELAEWKARIRQQWTKVKVLNVSWDEPDRYRVLTTGECFKIRAKVALGEIPPDQVSVQAYFGEQTADQIEHAAIVELGMHQDLGGGNYEYLGEMCPREGGVYGFDVRVVPKGGDRLSQEHELRLITWSGDGKQG
ncbi:MAG: alpha-glucan family phosphorylase, partial [Verrucomicrobiae bacterium]|nr:alpha-glucan family phosphorylase [Verrucomicrobiae bacterium]